MAADRRARHLVVYAPATTRQEATPVTERKWSMIRLDKGRYLLPSNDAKSIFLVERYWEDGSLERQQPDGSWRVIRGEFWMGSQASYAEFSAAVHGAPDFEEALAEVRWEGVIGPQSTRREVVDYVIGEL